jgi:hypothetical protein
MSTKIKDLSETLQTNLQASVDFKYFNRGREKCEYVYGVAKLQKIQLSFDITSPW